MHQDVAGLKELTVTLLSCGNPVWGQNAYRYVMTGVRRRRRCGRRSSQSEAVVYLENGFYLESPFYTNLHTDRVYNQQDMMSLSTSGRKLSAFEWTAENDASDDVNLKSTKLAYSSIPTSWTAIPDMTPRTTFGWQLSQF